MYSFVSDNRGDKVLSNAIAWKLVSGNEICIAAGCTGETILNRSRAGVNLVCYQGKNT
jgi:hypothetical protein